MSVVDRTGSKVDVAVANDGAMLAAAVTVPRLRFWPILSVVPTRKEAKLLVFACRARDESDLLRVAKPLRKCEARDGISVINVRKTSPFVTL
jgi:hypothetical protein